MIEILDPIGYVDRSTGFFKALAPRPGTLDGQTLGILCNGKPNADNLLRAVERHLRNGYRIADVIWMNKYEQGMLTIGAPDWMLDRMSQAGFVIHASGD